MNTPTAPDEPNQPTAKPGNGPLTFRRVIKKALTPFVMVVAALYFVIDALFYAIIKPIADWIGSLDIFPRMRAWIRSLGPYQMLALFLVPLIILEPVKPVGAYLWYQKHYTASVLVFTIGEILKVTIVERLFQLGRDRLMTIRAFAWTYNFIEGWISYLKSLPPWQAVMRSFLAIKAHARRIAAAIKAAAADIKRRVAAFWADPA
jgi:hypothetical protein